MCSSHKSLVLCFGIWLDSLLQRELDLIKEGLYTGFIFMMHKHTKLPVGQRGLIDCKIQIPLWRDEQRSLTGVGMAQCTTTNQ